MKRVSALVLLALVSVAPASPAAPETIGTRFRFMAGCWGGTKGATTFHEQWTAASPDLMLGLSFTTNHSGGGRSATNHSGGGRSATNQPGGGRSANKPKEPTEFEFLRIESKGGAPTYMAQPKGAPATPFVLSETDSTADTVTFVNMEHDFPKRVAYKKVDATTLLAWIDAGPKGSLRVEFPMKRVACPSASEN